MLNNIIAQHCMSLDFTNKVESSAAEVLQDEFALFLSKIDEFFGYRNPGGAIWFI